MTSKTEARAVSTKILDLRGWWDGSFPFGHYGFEISTTFAGRSSNGYQSWETSNTVCVRLALDEIEAFLADPRGFIRNDHRVDLLGEYDHDDGEYRRLSHYSAGLQPDFGPAVTDLRDGLIAALPGLFAQLCEQALAWKEGRRQGAHANYAAARHHGMLTMGVGSRGGYLAGEAASSRASIGRMAEEVVAFLAKIDALYVALSTAYIEPMMAAKAQECLSVA